MKERRQAQPELVMAQIRADLYTADAAIKGALETDAKTAKYLKGLAGYHLQQATEKMLKIQIYHADVDINYSKIYKHNIRELIQYGKSLNIDLNIPAYIEKNDLRISSWEAEGRYDIHVVVRTDTLQKCFGIIKDWIQELINAGYR